MKKLMIAAAAFAVAGATFAANIYDYKASVFYVDMVKRAIPSTINAAYNTGLPAFTAYYKVIKAAKLRGYVVTPNGCGCDKEKYAYPHGFLMLQSTVKGSSKFNIMPARLLSRVWAHQTTSPIWFAEGYLFAGLGSLSDGSVTNFMLTPTLPYSFGDKTTYNTWKLFGPFNTGTESVDEIGNKTVAFADAWLDAAGFGQARVWSKTIVPDEGCKNSIEVDGLCLYSLSGNVIGGLYLCSDNVIHPYQSYDTFLCQNWVETTDVITGMWAIRANNWIATAPLTKKDKETLAALAESSATGTDLTIAEDTPAADLITLGNLKAAAALLTGEEDFIFTLKDEPESPYVSPAFAAKWFYTDAKPEENTDSDSGSEVEEETP